MSSSQGAKAAEGVALACLAHLEQEEAMLSATLEKLRAVRSALMHGDLSALTRTLAEQRHTALAATELYKARAQLRQRITGVAGAPEGRVTISRLSQCVTEPLATRLISQRKRLSDMAKEVDRLNRGNMSLVRQSLDLLERLLSSLTGTDENSDRYSPSGQREQRRYGSIFQARC